MHPYLAAYLIAENSQDVPSVSRINELMYIANVVAHHEGVQVIDADMYANTGPKRAAGCVTCTQMLELVPRQAKLDVTYSLDAWRWFADNNAPDESPAPNARKIIARVVRKYGQVPSLQLVAYITRPYGAWWHAITGSKCERDGLHAINFTDANLRREYTALCNKTTYMRKEAAYDTAG